VAIIGNTDSGNNSGWLFSAAPGVQLSGTLRGQSSVSGGLVKTANAHATLGGEAGIIASLDVKYAKLLSATLGASATVSSAATVYYHHELSATLGARATVSARLDTPGDLSALLRSTASTLAALSKTSTQSATLTGSAAGRFRMVLANGNTNGGGNTGWNFYGAPVLASATLSARSSLLANVAKTATLSAHPGGAVSVSASLNVRYAKLLGATLGASASMPAGLAKTSRMAAVLAARSSTYAAFPRPVVAAPLFFFGTF
jgi:hypothetical protein